MNLKIIFPIPKLYVTGRNRNMHNFKHWQKFIEQKSKDHILPSSLKFLMVLQLQKNENKVLQIEKDFKNVRAVWAWSCNGKMMAMVSQKHGCSVHLHTDPPTPKLRPPQPDLSLKGCPQKQDQLSPNIVNLPLSVEGIFQLVWDKCQPSKCQLQNVSRNQGL